MYFIRKNGFILKITVSMLTFLMVGNGSMALAESYRIIPTHKVTLYHDEKVVGVYTQEAPLPDGTFISADGRCAVKLDDLYLVGEDQSLFSIATSAMQRNLLIKAGIVYFKTSAIRRPLVFVTPDGLISVHQIRLNAAFGDPSIKGYVTVTGDRSEVGVAAGGSMDVLTDKGPMTIQAGNKIILSQADMDIGLPEEEAPAAKQPPKPEPTTSMGKKIVYGSLGVGAVAGLAMSLGGGGGGGDSGGGTVSPSSP